MKQYEADYYGSLVEQMSKKSPAYPGWGYFTTTSDGKIIKLNLLELETFYDGRNDTH